MKALKLRLPKCIMPAVNAVTTPATKLGGEKCPAKNPIVPPKTVDNAPRCGPRNMPIIGAVIAAKVMNLLGRPTMWNTGMGKRQKTAYKAAKQMVKAESLAVNI
jgi:hypothetical protein